MVDEKFRKIDRKSGWGLARYALKTGLGLYLPTHGDRKSHVQVGMDALSAVDKGKDAYGYYKKYKAAKSAATAGKQGAKYASAAGGGLLLKRALGRNY